MVSNKKSNNNTKKYTKNPNKNYNAKSGINNINKSNGTNPTKPNINIVVDGSVKRKKNYKKKPLPKKIREQIWINYNGHKYSGKCFVPWCSNQIDVFNYQVGHNIPESKGGSSSIDNLRPLCANCNMSMGNQYTIDEWNNIMYTPETDIETGKKTLFGQFWKNIKGVITSFIK